MEAIFTRPFWAAASIEAIRVSVHLHLAAAIVVLRDVHDAALWEVGVELEALALQQADLRLPELAQVVGQDPRGHANGDALDTQHQHHRQLHRQTYRLAAASVVAGNELGERLVEEGLEGQRREATLDVSSSSRGMTRDQVAEVPLAIDEVVLVRQHHQRVADGGVAMGVELHGFADHVRHLVVAAVVHLEEGVEKPPLDRLQAVAQLRDRAVQDEVARVLQEVPLHQRFELRHLDA
jgi:hypothetical protein